MDVYPFTCVQVPLSAEQYQAARYEREMDDRNRPLSDEELDAIMPATGTAPFVAQLAVKLPITSTLTLACQWCDSHIAV